MALLGAARSACGRLPQAGEYARSCARVSSRVPLLRWGCWLALLAVLGLGATFTVLNVAFHGSEEYHFFRLAASFLGAGWCEPTVLQHKHYNFVGAEGPGIHWEGDAAFWSQFPCARSQYRVWEPEPRAAGAADAADAGVCRSAVVSAFFDIGRARWGTYRRTLGEYFTQARTVLSLRNPMVLFAGVEFAERMVAARRAAGLMDRTLVVAMDVHCAPPAWLETGTATVMCRQALWTWNKFLGTPERQEVWYNLVMWAKASFMRASAALPHPALAAARWFTWVDLGCHPPMCGEYLLDQCLDPAPWARPGRLRVAMLEPVGADDSASATDFARSHIVPFAGTIWGTDRANLLPAMDTFLDTVSELLGHNVADTDQTVFGWMFRRFPGAFDPYMAMMPNGVGGDWSNVVKGYTGHDIAGKVGAAVAGKKTEL